MMASGTLMPINRAASVFCTTASIALPYFVLLEKECRRAASAKPAAGIASCSFDTWMPSSVSPSLAHGSTKPRGFVLPWASEGLTLLGIHVSKMQLAIPAAGLALAALLHSFSRRTKYGKAMLAVVQNTDAARLMGINVPLAIMAAYALSTAFAGVAGIMIAPLFNVHSDMGTLFGLKAFAVAILGGITSAWGVMLAGLLFGLVESLITAFLGSSYTQILTFTLVIVALAIVPNGLFGRAELKKV